MEILWAQVAKNVLIKESKCCKMDSVHLHSGRCTRRRVANDNLRCVKQRKCASAIALKIRRDGQDGDWQAYWLHHHTRHYYGTWPCIN